MKELTINQIAIWNELLADFMEISWYQFHKAKHIESNELLGAESLHYHESWDWLMPAVEKIEALGYIITNDRSNTTIVKNQAFASAFIRVFGSRSDISKLESIYRAVGEFLEIHYLKK